MMTRRLFAGLLGSASAALAETKVNAVGFVRHKILRRPSQWTNEFSRANSVFKSMQVDVECVAPVRITLGYVGEEPLAIATVAEPSKRKNVSIGSVRWLEADRPLRVVIESSSPFNVFAVHPQFRVSQRFVNEWRAAHPEVTGSIPNPDSMAGHSFFRDYPEWQAVRAGWNSQSMLGGARYY